MGLVLFADATLPARLTSRSDHRESRELIRANKDAILAQLRAPGAM
ncbi:MAG TPA: hypothetical protein VM120_19110 [Bryobacteraceae bacterium]|nr:hypothetical protein [Bryobacteraceae bacterium]